MTIPFLIVARDLHPSGRFLLIEKFDSIDGPRHRVATVCDKEFMLERLEIMRMELCTSDHERMEFTRRYVAPLEKEKGP